MCAWAPLPCRRLLCGLRIVLVNAAGYPNSCQRAAAGSLWLQPGSSSTTMYTGWQCCTAQVGVLANRAIFAEFRGYREPFAETRSPTSISRAWAAVADGAEPEKLPQQGVRRGKRTS